MIALMWNIMQNFLENGPTFYKNAEEYKRIECHAGKEETDRHLSLNQ